MESTILPEIVVSTPYYVGRLLPATEKDVLEVSCDKYSFKLDRSKVCSLSDVFKAGYEKAIPKSHSPQTSLLHDGPFLLHKMFSFSNHSNYFTDRNEFPELKFAWDITTHAQMYALGHEFRAPLLKQLAAQKFKHALPKFEERGRWDELRRNRYFEELLNVIDYIFSSTPHNDVTLRKHILTFLATQARRAYLKRLRRIYRAVLTAVLQTDRKTRLAALIGDINREHQEWVSTLRLKEVRGRDPDYDSELDLAVKTPSRVRVAA